MKSATRGRAQRHLRLGGLVLGAVFTVLVAGCGSSGDEPRGDESDQVSLVGTESLPSTTVEVIANSNIVAPVESLTNIVTSLTADGGAILTARLDTEPVERISPQQVGRFDNVYAISDVTVLWSPNAETARAASAVTSVRVNLTETGEKWLMTAGPTADVVVAWSGSEEATSLISLARDDRPADPFPGRLRLSLLMRSLRDAELSRPAYPECSEREMAPAGATDVETLVAHVAAIEEAIVLNQRAGRFEQMADRLSDELAMIDDVTGLEVAADTNDLARQLNLGVSAGDLVPSKVVPILLDMSTFEGEAALVYFIADQEVLGFTSAGRVPELILSQLPVPRHETDIEVWLTQSGVDDCGQLDEDATLALTIPYHFVAGATTRALVNLGEGETTALDGDQFLSLIEKES